MNWKTVAVAAICIGLLGSQQAMAKDWYVAEGSRGDGTKAKPFDDPQRAIGKAVAGDVIHVTQGTYHGKLRIGYIIIDKRGLTLVGGYKDKTFTKRNPFKYPTMISPNPDSKSASFKYGDIRTHMSTHVTDHQSTTIDGFWFDRKSQNSYKSVNASPAECPGCISHPIGSNTKPIIWFEHADCHIRNSVFMNSASYAVRVTGDGSTIENNLFLNVHYAGIDIYGKHKKIGKGYPFHKFTIKNNTFVSAWNTGLERGGGSFIFHSGNADITIDGNIFHLTNGNKQSMGYTVKDERNFKGDEWVHFMNNSSSQIRGGFATIYMTELTASANIDYIADLQDTPWEASGNDEENPFFKLDKTWLERYTKATPKMDPKNIKVKMDDFNKMRRMMGLPLDAGKQKMGGQFLAIWYPIEHVKTGVFWKPTNAKLKGRGLNANGPFPIKKAKLCGKGGAAGGAAVAAVDPNKSYDKIDFTKLWTKGESLVGKSVELKAYYMGWDTSFASGFGKKAKPYLVGASNKSHKIIKMRKVEEMDKKEYPLKGYVMKGSAAEAYLKKKAKRTCSSKKKDCNFSFVVKGTVKKAGAKVNMGQGPQIIVVIDSITKR